MNSIEPAPTAASVIDASGLVSQPWVRWFNQLLRPAVNANTASVAATAVSVTAINDTSLPQVNTTLTAQASEIAGAQTSIASLQQQVTTLQSQVATLQSQLAALQATLAGGETHTVPLAKLTPTGAAGSVTFTAGVETAHVDPS